MPDDEHTLIDDYQPREAASDNEFTLVDDYEYTAKEASRIVGKARQTLANMRAQGTGPAYRKYSERCVRYPGWALRQYREKYPIVLPFRGEA